MVFVWLSSSNRPKTSPAAPAAISSRIASWLLGSRSSGALIAFGRVKRPAHYLHQMPVLKVRIGIVQMNVQRHAVSFLRLLVFASLFQAVSGLDQDRNVQRVVFQMQCIGFGRLGPFTGRRPETDQPSLAGPPVPGAFPKQFHLFPFPFVRGRRRQRRNMADPMEIVQPALKQGCASTATARFPANRKNRRFGGVIVKPPQNTSMVTMA